MSDLQFSTFEAPSAAEFIDVLRRSTLGERRPLEDMTCMQQMTAHANLWVTCRADGILVGVARCLTDFGYVCYLADLAVDQNFARRGIGRRLIEETCGRLGPEAKIVLIAAPKAVDYYPHIGFTQHPSAWTLEVAGKNLSCSQMDAARGSAPWAGRPKL